MCSVSVYDVYKSRNTVLLEILSTIVAGTDQSKCSNPIIPKAKNIICS